jgi:hypothetical protein
MWKPVILATVIGLTAAMPAQGAHHVLSTDLFGAVTATEQTPAIQSPPQDHAQHQPVEPQTSQPAAPGAMPGMMQKHQRMMADMAAAAVKLETLVNDMNSATGQAKLELMANVVGELVRQQKAMHEHMGMMMCGGMMQHK